MRQNLVYIIATNGGARVGMGKEGERRQEYSNTYRFTHPYIEIQQQDTKRQKGRATKQARARVGLTQDY